MPTGILFGQVVVVLCVTLGGIWAATQWTAVALGHQAALGPPWFDLFGTSIYHPLRLFEWWYFFDVVDVNYLDRSATTILAGGSGE